jgi:hypothetical protein
MFNDEIERKNSQLEKGKKTQVNRVNSSNSRFRL